MARPAKSLQERVRDRSFLARRHDGLLAGPLQGPKRLRDLQERWQHADSDRVRRAVALEYEAAIKDRAPVEPVTVALDVAQPPARFFPAMFAHVKGPAAGEPL